MRNYLAEYLKDHTLDQLTEEYGIKYSIFNTNKSHDLVIFSYSQIDSPKTLPIVRLSRGIILEKDTWKIVSYPFYRFFNFEEVLEERSKFNWDKVVSTQKIDGSIIEYFFYDGSWYMSTRSMIGGENKITSCLYTFKDLFLMAIQPYTEEEFQKMLTEAWPEGTISFIFELVSPFNQIVTPYKETKLYLIGARYLGTNTKDFKQYQELKYDDVYNSLSDKFRNLVKIPKMIPLNDENGHFKGFEEMKQLSESGEATDEGYVVTDFSTLEEDSASFPRTKVKNSSYVAIHHLRSSIDGDDKGISNYKILNLLFKNEQDEFLSVLPHYKDAFFKVEEKFNKFVDYMNSIQNSDEFKKFLEISKTSEKANNQKNFALYIKDFKWKNIFFLMYNKGYSTWRDAITSITEGNGSDSFFKKLFEEIK